MFFKAKNKGPESPGVIRGRPPFPPPYGSPQMRRPFPGQRLPPGVSPSQPIRQQRSPAEKGLDETLKKLKAIGG